MNTETNFTHGL